MLSATVLDGASQGVPTEGHPFSYLSLTVPFKAQTLPSVFLSPP